MKRPGTLAVMESHEASPRRRLDVEGLVNGRDLGGLRRRDGSVTPSKVFYRSENVDRITPRGWEQIRAEGIRTVVDLRQPGERTKDTNGRPDWLTTIEVDLDGLDDQCFWADYWDNGLVTTALYFLPHLDAMPERAGAAVSAIVSAPPGGVLFHCVSGRDRTGMIALILLVAIDTTPEAIVDDYLDTVRSGGALAASTGRPNDEPDRETLCQAHGTTTEGAFRAAVDGFDLAKFLVDAAVTDSHRNLLMTWRQIHHPESEVR